MTHILMPWSPRAAWPVSCERRDAQRIAYTSQPNWALIEAATILSHPSRLGEPVPRQYLRPLRHSARHSPFHPMSKRAVVRDHREDVRSHLSDTPGCLPQLRTGPDKLGGGVTRRHDSK